MEPLLKSQLAKLNPKEKLDVAEFLWDSLISESETIGIPEHHVGIVKERLKTLIEDKRRTKSWNEIKEKYRVKK